MKVSTYQVDERPNTMTATIQETWESISDLECWFLVDTMLQGVIRIFRLLRSIPTLHPSPTYSTLVDSYAGSYPGSYAAEATFFYRVSI